MCEGVLLATCILLFGFLCNDLGQFQRPVSPFSELKVFRGRRPWLLSSLVEIVGRFSRTVVGIFAWLDHRGPQIRLRLRLLAGLIKKTRIELHSLKWYRDGVFDRLRSSWCGFRVWYSRCRL